MCTRHALCATIDAFGDSTARNATESPLLRLPPELRYRIYDLVFGSTPVHIRAAENHEYDEDFRNYRLSVCEHPREHVETPRRYAEWVNISLRTRIPGCTIREHDDGKPLSSLDANLGLLQACRQIHHEAALKPFTEIPFYYMARKYRSVPGFDGFVEALAPAQFKALSRVRFAFENLFFEPNTSACRMLAFGCLPDWKTMRKLTGLKDVEIVLSPQMWDETEARGYLADLAVTFGSPDWREWKQTIKDLRLKRLRLTIEADFHERYKYEKSEAFPTFASRGETSMIEDWLRHRELQLQFGDSVANGDEAVPPYGIQQNDHKVSMPPWGTPEGVRKFDLARAEEARLTELLKAEADANWNAILEEQIREDEYRDSRDDDELQSTSSDRASAS